MMLNSSEARTGSFVVERVCLPLLMSQIESTHRLWLCSVMRCFNAKHSAVRRKAIDSGARTYTAPLLLVGQDTIRFMSASRASIWAQAAAYFAAFDGNLMDGPTIGPFPRYTEVLRSN